VSGYEGSSFAPFNTGNPQWDQNFNSLSRGLFGDPSAYGRGVAAGAAARESIIKGDTSISERNAAASQLLMALGLDRTGRPQLPPTPTFHPSGVPGAAPIMDPPAGMQMSAPPPVSSISPPGFLARLFGAGDHPNDKGVGTTGTPPPASSPAPNAGAPPAPNTTTSNGQVPTNDQGSGPINYNAINTSGGGRQYAPAAQANGSPAPVPINLGSLMALGAYAGQDANVIKQGGQAYIASAFDHGVIPWNTATQLSGLTGNNAPYESDQATGRTRISEAGATARTQIHEAAETGRTGMVVGGENFRAGQTPEVSVGPDGKLVYTTRGAIVPGQTPAFSPQQYASDSQRAQAMDKVVQTYQLDATGKPDVSRPTVPMTLRDALAQKAVMTPESTDAVNALLRGATLTAPQAGPTRNLADTVAATTTAGQPPQTANEAFQTKQVRDKLFENIYAPSESGAVIKRSEAGAPTWQAEYAFNDYAEFIKRQFPSMSPDVVNMTVAQHLQQLGYLPSKDQVNGFRTRSGANFWGNPDIDQQVTKGGTAGKFMIPLLKDYTSPITGVVVSADPRPGGVGGTGAKPPAPPVPKTTGTPIARAHPGAKPGDRVPVGGRTGIVGNDGLVYPE
jgi:hypothetical protein